jgi:tetratricopeptide (TPR) repeat protein
MASVDPLLPWAEAAEDDTPLERQMSRLFASVPGPQPLGDVARQRVARRLRTGTPRSTRLMLVRLVAVGVVIGVTGAAAAQWAAVHWFGMQHELAMPHERSVVTAPPTPPKAVKRAAPLAVAAAPALPGPVSEPASSAAFPIQAPPALPASSSASRLGQEAASLESALSALKAGGKGNAARALLELDQHLQKFPGGTLELEARVARVDALLVLGRRHEARRELSSLPIERVGRKSELRLIRAELRADDDCRAALTDFQVLVDQALPSAWAERALFGRGACLLKLGDQAAAYRDFDRYLERFPSGRFAQQIRAQRP